MSLIKFFHGAAALLRLASTLASLQSYISSVTAPTVSRLLVVKK